MQIYIEQGTVTATWEPMNDVLAYVVAIEEQSEYVHADAVKLGAWFIDLHPGEYTLTMSIVRMVNGEVKIVTASTHLVEVPEWESIEAQGGTAVM